MTSECLRMHGLLGCVALLACAASPCTARERLPDAGYVLANTVGMDEMSPAQRASIERMLANNLAQLQAHGLLLRTTPKIASGAGLVFPLQPARSYPSWANWATSYFVDHDPDNPQRLRDYACGERTYDMVGYNHGGTDYVPWPFPWFTMDEGSLSIVAAAAGVVVGRMDGNFDRNCEFRGTSYPVNAVYIRQDDGLLAWYLHMKKGSVAPLEIGARVEAGDYLGLIGSSGRSSVPHLHFELTDSDGNVVDPRHGECNSGPELWAEVQLYENPRLTTLTTHSAEPLGVACGVAGGEAVHESTFFKDHFLPGDELWVFASWGDHRTGQVSRFTILRPDASVFAEWTFDLASHNLSEDFYSGTGFAWRQSLPTDAMQGIWAVRAQVEGQSHELRFTLGDVIFRERPPPNPQAERAAVRRAQLAHCRAGSDAAACPLP